MEDVLDNEIEMDEVLEMGSGAIGYDEAIESPVPRGALKVLLPGDDVMGLEEHKVGGGLLGPSTDGDVGMSEAQTAASMDGGGAIKLSEADLDKEETQEAAVEGEWSYHRGYAFDVGAEETASPSSAARAKRIRAEIGDEPLTGIESRPVYCAIKRAFDIVFSAAVLICFCWLFAIIAIVIKIDDPKGPVLFKQERVGKDGKTFTMHKFRTMCVDAEDKLPELQALNEKDGPVFKIARDPRNTRVGRVLRKASLDETIQFFDVLTGKMSIVGPRPALPKEVATYDDYQRQRLLVKPGITCYWQTRRNRDTVTFDEWIDLDLLYIKKCSVWSDFKLIIQTVGVVLTMQGS